MIDQVTTHQAEEDIRNETASIYIDGQIVPKAEAKVSVFDSGFMLGDGVWEGLRLNNRRWAFIDEHLDRLATVPHLRGLPMTQDPKLNSHSKLNCILACIAAEKAGADEALMLDVHGLVNTTNACNLFIVQGSEVWTSPGDYCMNGITRQKVIDLCRDYEIPALERNFSLVDVYSADEAFLTGTFGAQTPVGEIGPMTKQLRSLYKNLISQENA